MYSNLKVTVKAKAQQSRTTVSSEPQIAVSMRQNHPLVELCTRVVE
jgi:hypothetical protein